jgi:TIR domain/SPOR domain
MPRIVISYRRSDAASATGRISEKLVSRFGEESVFTDIDNIPLGTDYRKYVRDIISASDVVLVVVGSRWLDKRNAKRLQDPKDPVHFEIQTAMELGVPIIPVLVDDARMPPAEVLPGPLKDFHFRNAAIVEPGRDFRVHMDRLTREIEKLLNKPREAPPATVTAPEPEQVSPPVEDKAIAEPTPIVEPVNRDAGDIALSAVQAALEAAERATEQREALPAHDDPPQAVIKDAQPIEEVPLEGDHPPEREADRDDVATPPWLIDRGAQPAGKVRKPFRVGRMLALAGISALCVVGAIGYLVFAPTTSVAPVIRESVVPMNVAPSVAAPQPTAVAPPQPTAVTPPGPAEPKRVKTLAIRGDPPDGGLPFDKRFPAGGYAVQISSQRTEAEALSAYRAQQAKYPGVLGGREPVIRRADLGDKGVYYRAQTSAFATAEDANAFCARLKAAGGQCVVVQNN